MQSITPRFQRATHQPSFPSLWQYCAVGYHHDAVYSPLLVCQHCGFGVCWDSPEIRCFQCSAPNPGTNQYRGACTNDDTERVQTCEYTCNDGYSLFQSPPEGNPSAFSAICDSASPAYSSQGGFPTVPPCGSCLDQAPMAPAQASRVRSFMPVVCHLATCLACC